MPFGSYQVSDEDAVRNAIRFVKEAGADAVKLEGAGPSLSRAALVGAGIPVMGHLGLTPQSATMLGGFRRRGRRPRRRGGSSRTRVALEAGRVLRARPRGGAGPGRRADQRAAGVPTIGIGSGADCDGQVLVLHDLLGLYERGRSPRFTKRYAEIGADIQGALERFAADVRSGAFPTEEHTYAMPEDELEAFLSSPSRTSTNGNVSTKIASTASATATRPAEQPPALDDRDPVDQQPERPEDEGALGQVEEERPRPSSSPPERNESVP